MVIGSTMLDTFLEYAENALAEKGGDDARSLWYVRTGNDLLRLWAFDVVQTYNDFLDVLHMCNNIFH